jgi:hypothetical protein
VVEEKKSESVKPEPVKPKVAPKPPPDPEEEALRAIGRQWNAIVNSMISAEKAWGQILELQLKVSREKMQFAPLEVQKAVSRFGKAQFNVMLARFVDYYRSQGGLEAMKIKEVK